MSCYWLVTHTNEDVRRKIQVAIEKIGGTPDLGQETETEVVRPHLKDFWLSKGHSEKKKILLTDEEMEINLVEILQELAESEHKACPKHQRERWTNISYQTKK